MAGPTAQADGFPFRFAYRRSGNCCSRPGGVVRVAAGDVVRIAGHLGMSEVGFRARYVAAAGDRLVESLDRRCAFLEGPRFTRRTIYEAPRFCPGITASDAGGP